MARKSRIRLNPTSLFWLFGHLILLLVGIVFFTASGLPSVKTIAPILQGVGGSLVATGIAGEVLFLYVSRSDATREQFNMFARAGLTHIFPFRSVQIKDEYDKRLVDAKEIDIIGFGLSSLREDYAHQFSTWSRKSKVRILILDPNYPTKRSNYADQRDKEERHKAGKIRRDVTAFLEAVSNSENLVKNRFEVKLLRTLPSVNMFRIDDEIFWGPYFSLQQSRNTPTLLVHGGFLYEKLREHFESLWNNDEFSTPAISPNG